jgi:hypothetical protein
MKNEKLYCDNPKSKNIVQKNINVQSNVDFVM